MQLNQLKPNNKRMSKKRVGRGGKRGTYSGRGVKGQGSRAGRKFQPIMRELIKRFPKMKGYREGTISEKKAVVNLSVLEKRFNDGDIISPDILVAKRIIHKTKGKMPQVKILAKGALKKKLTFENVEFSQKAKKHSV